MININNRSNRKKEDIPFIYLYIYKKVYEDTIRFNEVSYDLLISELKKIIWRIPRKYYDLIIKELIDCGLIELLDGGRYPVYKIKIEDYDKRINELNELEKSGLRFKILKDKYEKLLKEIESNYSLEQRYRILKCNYEKLIRRLELKKLEGYHYW